MPGVKATGVHTRAQGMKREREEGVEVKEADTRVDGEDRTRAL